MSNDNFYSETVTSVHHWNDTLFSFRTTRSAGLRFKTGQFVMIGLEIENKPLLRAYSFASAHYDEFLEFYSIKVQNGPLTSRLQHLKIGDQLLVGKKPTGTLILDNLKPGRNLYLLSSGTGLAPFISTIQDFDYYEKFEHIVLVHSVREISELGYRDFITKELPTNEYLGEHVKKQLIYLPTVTRENFAQQARITELIDSGSLTKLHGLPALDPKLDRAMICGNPSMLKDIVSQLKSLGFEEGSMSKPGDFVIERAFVEK